MWSEGRALGMRKNQSRNAVILVVLAAALVATGGAAWFLLVKNESGPPLNHPPQPSAALPVTLDVLVAIQNIEEGVELKAALFRKENRSASDFASLGVVGDFDQIAGAYSKSFIPAGQPLLADHLTFRAPVNSVVPQIRVGYRAITIKLDKQATNEGWARAGVRVDVLWAWKQGTVSQASVIAQNVRVLSSGTSVSSEFGGESKIIQNGESTVTLEVSTEDQKRLKLASGKGELRLLLRGDEDTAELPDGAILTVEQIMGPQGEPNKAGPPDQGWVVIDGKKYRVVGNTLIPG